jgi:lipopolysaccharide export LptBFGC system permease protein LptF
MHKLTGVARILAEKKEKARIESIRRSKMKSQLDKLYKAENIIIQNESQNKEDHPIANKKNRVNKPHTFQKQLNKINEAKAEKKKKFQESQKKKQDKIEVLELSKNNRLQTRISLSKRTKKGQPIMANVINHLLNKIQKSQ